MDGSEASQQRRVARLESRWRHGVVVLGLEAVPLAEQPVLLPLHLVQRDELLPRDSYDGYLDIAKTFGYLVLGAIGGEDPDLALNDFRANLGTLADESWRGWPWSSWQKMIWTHW